MRWHPFGRKPIEPELTPEEEAARDRQRQEDMADWAADDPITDAEREEARWARYEYDRGAEEDRRRADAEARWAQMDEGQRTDYLADRAADMADASEEAEPWPGHDRAVEAAALAQHETDQARLDMHWERYAQAAGVPMPQPFEPEMEA